jgi:putative addiction module killer protein
VTNNALLPAQNSRPGSITRPAREFRIEMGHFGDVAPVGEGVSELRIFHGPGYRVYFVRKGAVVVILLSGGDKNSQQAYIGRAKEIARQLEE